MHWILITLALNGQMTVIDKYNTRTECITAEAHLMVTIEKRIMEDISAGNRIGELPKFDCISST